MTFTPPSLHEPFRWRGLRVGLFGGTFNPPHEGHVHACEIALKYLRLDAVWWLVSPGNPLKPKTDTPPLDMRVAACRSFVKNPRIIVSDIEHDLGTARTLDTVSSLVKHFPHTDFIWLAGTDIAGEFHKWHQWRALAQKIPFAFIGRPTQSGLVRANALRRLSFLSHTPLLRGEKFSGEKRRIYWIFGEPLNPVSSTLLRRQMQDLQDSTQE
jgi:nicotinate-nucleotide adenylyltransferase